MLLFVEFALLFKFFQHFIIAYNTNNIVCILNKQ